MRRIVFWLVAVLLALGAIAGVGAYTYFILKQPTRDGELPLRGLQAKVVVRYDERGVPHIQAQTEADLYRALGWVHAQDRLFQMEIVRRLANGELAEVLGPKLIKTDRLFRTLGLRAHAQVQAQQLNPADPAVAAQLAYLDGVNQYVTSGSTPVEFDLLGMPKRPFTLTDSLTVSGYLAYSFAAAFKTEPVLTAVRDQLGPAYLRIFDTGWNPLGVLEAPPPGAALAPPSLAPTAHAAPQAPLPDAPQMAARSAATLRPDTLLALAEWREVDTALHERLGMPALEGSNAWAVAGDKTESGAPILAGDPHIGFGVPQVWFEAHLMLPNWSLHGHFHALVAHALLGVNREVGWSLTMLQNDDMDLVALRRNPANPRQIAVDGQWADLQIQEDSIAVKGYKPVKLTREISPYGPLIQRAFRDTLGDEPVALWWTFLQSDNQLLQAFYQLNHARTREQARAAASLIAAPGLNIVWASASGDIAWWAGARLPIRPPGVDPAFILNEAQGQARKLGYFRFQDNPQEENPPRGYVVSANQQPFSTSGIAIPGYYNPPDRAQALVDRLGRSDLRWNMLNTQSIQNSTQTGYFWRVLRPLIPVLAEVVHEPLERSVFDSLAQWDGQYIVQNVPPTVFTQFVYELTRLAMADELGDVLFKSLLQTRALDHALPLLVADADSPWWDKVNTDKVETRRDIVRQAWSAAFAHLRATLGDRPGDWSWGPAHTLTHGHPLAQSWPLTWLFNVGPLPVPGAREVPNNLATTIGPAPWAVTYGPSARRIIDFGLPDQARAMAPVGQSGVPFNTHYADQAPAYVAGGYLPLYLKPEDVRDNARSTLVLRPDGGAAAPIQVDAPPPAPPSRPAPGGASSVPAPAK